MNKKRTQRQYEIMITLSAKVGITNMLITSQVFLIETLIQV